MAAEQLDLFELDKPIVKVRKRKKEVPLKEKPRLRLKKGEIAYQCAECDDKPTIYNKLIPKLTCPKCKMLVEVVDEKL